jgi:hypothetical protein
MIQEIKSKAAPSSYILLGGIWFILCILNIYLWITKPTAGTQVPAIITGVVGSLFCLWLYGFKMSLNEKFFEYRNGFFRTHRLYRKNITGLKNTYIKSRGIEIPRPTITSIDGDNIILNLKPFDRNVFKILDEIKKYNADQKLENAEIEK